MMVAMGGGLNYYYLWCVGGFYGMQAWHFGHQIVTYFKTPDGEEAKKLQEKTHCFQVKYKFGYVKGLQQINGDPNGLKVFML